MSLADMLGQDDVRGDEYSVVFPKARHRVILVPFRGLL